MFESAAAGFANAPLSPPLFFKATATLSPPRDAQFPAHGGEIPSICHHNGTNWLGNACHFSTIRWRARSFIIHLPPHSQPLPALSISLALSPSPCFPAPPPAVNGSLAPPTRTRLLLQPPVLSRLANRLISKTNVATLNKYPSISSLTVLASPW